MDKRLAKMVHVRILYFKVKFHESLYVWDNGLCCLRPIAMHKNVSKCYHEIIR